MHDNTPADSHDNSLAIAIGSRVRRERQTSGWTLDQLATAAGVSRRMIINVEQGSANPSLGTLLKISNALGIGLPSLVEPPREDPVTVTRCGDGVTLWSSESGGQGILVASVDSSDVVELWDWTLAPGDIHASSAHSHGSGELVNVLHGTLIIEVGERSFTLETGDAASFSGDVPHAYKNPGTISARFSLAVFEPGTGSSSRPENRRV
jgi:DNA-binding XRE family transcriptional regulator